MIILKAQTFPSIERVTKFVNENNINKEVILEITHATGVTGTPIYTVFFYGDSNTEERVPGFFG